MIAPAPFLSVLQHEGTVLARTEQAFLYEMGPRFVLWWEAGQWQVQSLDRRYGEDPQAALAHFLESRHPLPLLASWE